MKKITILAILIVSNMNLFAQVEIDKSQNNLYQVKDNFVRTYRIYPTQNVWYFIKLNTQTGQMWQIEFDQRKTNQQEIPLNSLSLVEKPDEVDNRFTLYTTNNSWNFLLLDQINGNLWQFNWSTKPGKSKLIAIQ